ncbi:serine-rich adhesin for platelets-like [Macrobrachium rosenbergii]|uniref:serine-rich adhesin for platelets-like n=1 Tax=Macrobrachium rosenbergii TaxID=79674 RepID=UPI0034D46BB2
MKQRDLSGMADVVETFEAYADRAVKATEGGERVSIDEHKTEADKGTFEIVTSRVNLSRETLESVEKSEIKDIDDGVAKLDACSPEFLGREERIRIYETNVEEDSETTTSRVSLSRDSPEKAEQNEIDISYGSAKLDANTSDEVTEKSVKPPIPGDSKHEVYYNEHESRHMEQPAADDYSTSNWKEIDLNIASSEPVEFAPLDHHTGNQVLVESASNQSQLFPSEFEEESLTTSDHDVERINEHQPVSEGRTEPVQDSQDFHISRTEDTTPFRSDSVREESTDVESFDNSYLLESEPSDNDFQMLKPGVGVTSQTLLLDQKISASDNSEVSSPETETVHLQGFSDLRSSEEDLQPRGKEIMYLLEKEPNEQGSSEMETLVKKAHPEDLSHIKSSDQGKPEEEQGDFRYSEIEGDEKADDNSGPVDEALTTEAPEKQYTGDSETDNSEVLEEVSAFYGTSLSGPSESVAETESMTKPILSDSRTLNEKQLEEQEFKDQSTIKPDVDELHPYGKRSSDDLYLQKPKPVQELIKPSSEGEPSHHENYDQAQQEVDVDFSLSEEKDGGELKISDSVIAPVPQKEPSDEQNSEESEYSDSDVSEEEMPRCQDQTFSEPAESSECEVMVSHAEAVSNLHLVDPKHLPETDFEKQKLADDAVEMNISESVQNSSPSENESSEFQPVQNNELSPKEEKPSHLQASDETQRELGSGDFGSFGIKLVDEKQDENAVPAITVSPSTEPLEQTFEEKSSFSSFNSLVNEINKYPDLSSQLPSDQSLYEVEIPRGEAVSELDSSEPTALHENGLKESEKSESSASGALETYHSNDQTLQRSAADEEAASELVSSEPTALRESGLKESEKSESSTSGTLETYLSDDQTLQRLGADEEVVSELDFSESIALHESGLKESEKSESSASGALETYLSDDQTLQRLGADEEVVSELDFSESTALHESGLKESEKSESSASGALETYLSDDQTLQRLGADEEAVSEQDSSESTALHESGLQESEKSESSTSGALETYLSDDQTLQRLGADEEAVSELDSSEPTAFYESGLKESQKSESSASGALETYLSDDQTLQHLGVDEEVVSELDSSESTALHESGLQESEKSESSTSGALETYLSDDQILQCLGGDEEAVSELDSSESAALHESGLQESEKSELSASGALETYLSGDRTALHSSDDEEAVSEQDFSESAALHESGLKESEKSESSASGALETYLSDDQTLQRLGADEEAVSELDSSERTALHESGLKESQKSESSASGALETYLSDDQTLQHLGVDEEVVSEQDSSESAALHESGLQESEKSESSASDALETYLSDDQTLQRLGADEEAASEQDSSESTALYESGLQESEKLELSASGALETYLSGDRTVLHSSDDEISLQEKETLDDNNVQESEPYSFQFPDSSDQAPHAKDDERIVKKSESVITLLSSEELLDMENTGESDNSDLEFTIEEVSDGQESSILESSEATTYETVALDNAVSKPVSFDLEVLYESTLETSESSETSSLNEEDELEISASDKDLTQKQKSSTEHSETETELELSQSTSSDKDQLELESDSSESLEEKDVSKEEDIKTLHSYGASELEESEFDNVDISRLVSEDRDLLTSVPSENELEKPEASESVLELSLDKMLPHPDPDELGLFKEKPKSVLEVTRSETESEFSDSQSSSDQVHPELESSDSDTEEEATGEIGDQKSMSDVEEELDKQYKEETESNQIDFPKKGFSEYQDLPLSVSSSREAMVSYNEVDPEVDSFENGLGDQEVNEIDSLEKLSPLEQETSDEQFVEQPKSAIELPRSVAEPEVSHPQNSFDPESLKEKIEKIREEREMETSVSDIDSSFREASDEYIAKADFSDSEFSKQEFIDEQDLPVPVPSELSSYVVAASQNQVVFKLDLLDSKADYEKESQMQKAELPDGHTLLQLDSGQIISSGLPPDISRTQRSAPDQEESHELNDKDLPWLEKDLQLQKAKLPDGHTLLQLDNGQIISSGLPSDISCTQRSAPDQEESHELNDKDLPWLEKDLQLQKAKLPDGHTLLQLDNGQIISSGLPSDISCTQRSAPDQEESHELNDQDLPWHEKDLQLQKAELPHGHTLLQLGNGQIISSGLPSDISCTQRSAPDQEESHELNDQDLPWHEKDLQLQKAELPHGHTLLQLGNGQIISSELPSDISCTQRSAPDQEESHELNDQDLPWLEKDLQLQKAKLPDGHTLLQLDNGQIISSGLPSDISCTQRSAPDQEESHELNDKDLPWLEKDLQMQKTELPHAHTLLQLDNGQIISSGLSSDISHTQRSAPDQEESHEPNDQDLPWLEKGLQMQKAELPDGHTLLQLDNGQIISSGLPSDISRTQRSAPDLKESHEPNDQDLPGLEIADVKLDESIQTKVPALTSQDPSDSPIVPYQYLTNLSNLDKSYNPASTLQTDEPNGSEIDMSGDACKQFDEIIYPEMDAVEGQDLKESECDEECQSELKVEAKDNEEKTDPVSGEGDAFVMNQSEFEVTGNSELPILGSSELEKSDEGFSLLEKIGKDTDVVKVSTEKSLSNKEHESEVQISDGQVLLESVSMPGSSEQNILDEQEITELKSSESDSLESQFSDEEDQDHPGTEKAFHFESHALHDSPAEVDDKDLYELKLEEIYPAQPNALLKDASATLETDMQEALKSKSPDEDHLNLDLVEPCDELILANDEKLSEDKSEISDIQDMLLTESSEEPIVHSRILYGQDLTEPEGNDIHFSESGVTYQLKSNEIYSDSDLLSNHNVSEPDSEIELALEKTDSNPEDIYEIQVDSFVIESQVTDMTAQKSDIESAPKFTTSIETLETHFQDFEPLGMALSELDLESNDNFDKPYIKQEEPSETYSDFGLATDVSSMLQDSDAEGLPRANSDETNAEAKPVDEYKQNLNVNLATFQDTKFSEEEDWHQKSGDKESIEQKTQDDQVTLAQEPLVQGSYEISSSEMRMLTDEILTAGTTVDGNSFLGLESIISPSEVNDFDEGTAVTETDSQKSPPPKDLSEQYLQESVGTDSEETHVSVTRSENEISPKLAILAEKDLTEHEGAISDKDEFSENFVSDSEEQDTSFSTVDASDDRKPPNYDSVDLDIVEMESSDGNGSVVDVADEMLLVENISVSKPGYSEMNALVSENNVEITPEPKIPDLSTSDFEDTTSEMKFSDGSHHALFSLGVLATVDAEHSLQQSEIRDTDLEEVALTFEDTEVTSSVNLTSTSNELQADGSFKVDSEMQKLHHSEANFTEQSELGLNQTYSVDSSDAGKEAADSMTDNSEPQVISDNVRPKNSTALTREDDTLMKDEIEKSESHSLAPSTKGSLVSESQSERIGYVRRIASSFTRLVKELNKEKVRNISPARSVSERVDTHEVTKSTSASSDNVKIKIPADNETGGPAEIPEVPKDEIQSQPFDENSTMPKNAEDRLVKNYYKDSEAAVLEVSIISSGFKDKQSAELKSNIMPASAVDSHNSLLLSVGIQGSVDYEHSSQHSSEQDHNHSDETNITSVDKEWENSYEVISESFESQTLETSSQMNSEIQMTQPSETNVSVLDELNSDQLYPAYFCGAGQEVNECLGNDSDLQSSTEIIQSEDSSPNEQYSTKHSFLESVFREAKFTEKKDKSLIGSDSNEQKSRNCTPEVPESDDIGYVKRIAAGFNLLASEPSKEKVVSGRTESGTPELVQPSDHGHGVTKIQSTANNGTDHDEFVNKESEVDELGERGIITDMSDKSEIKEMQPQSPNDTDVFSVLDETISQTEGKEDENVHFSATEVTEGTNLLENDSVEAIDSDYLDDLVLSDNDSLCPRELCASYSEETFVNQVIDDVPPQTEAAISTVTSDHLVFNTVEATDFVCQTEESDREVNVISEADEASFDESLKLMEMRPEQVAVIRTWMTMLI